MEKSPEYCVIKCRVSDPAQLKGGGLERQQSACEHFASERGWLVDKVIRTPHSATTSERDDMEADIEYIKRRKRMGVDIRYYLVQGIDRLTRVGTIEYWGLKKKLEDIGVSLVDTAGIVQPQKNTLAHLGKYAYDWSIYSSSETAETVEALKAKDEARTILTRMIGAEIGLTLKGYAARGAPDGLENKRILAGTKERGIRQPSSRADFFRRMFEMRAAGVSDIEICEQLNAMGFRTRIKRRWDRSDPENPVWVGQAGGKLLTPKQLQRYILQAEYAGYSYEKWTNGEVVKLQGFDGIVSVDVYNRANRGKRYLKIYADGSVEMLLGYSAWDSVKRMRDNPQYPWKCIPCDICGSELLGSAATGKSGERYEAYHCGGMKLNTKRNHPYFRVRKAVFEKNVLSYIESLRFAPAFMNGLELHLVDVYRTREKEVLTESSAVSRTVADLKAEAAQNLKAFSLAESTLVRRKLEEEMATLEEKITQVESKRGRIEITEKSIRSFRKYVEKLMEHPGELLTNVGNIGSRKALLGLFFEEIPTYQKILNGTPKLQPLFRLSEEFKREKSQLVSPLYLGWNTLENMVLQWNHVFGELGISDNELQYT